MCSLVGYCMNQISEEYWSVADDTYAIVKRVAKIVRTLKRVV